MSDPTDQQLLSAWARHRDESAFRALLGRHAGFVYGTTLRRVGDAGLAQEISQDVFARLSQNAAGLLEHPTIAGWLHRSAMLLALDRLRGRARHARKLQTLAQMHASPPARDPWASALPHLDEALDRLGASEREVLMLHFAERRTFPQIAKDLDSTPDAIRMRANRALASLSKMLGKKGAVLPATTLAASLPGAFGQAAPAALLALSPAALAGLGKVGVLSLVLHTMETARNAKAFAAAALALGLAAPLFFQQSRINAAQARIAGLERTHAEAIPGRPPAPPAQPDAAPAQFQGRGVDLKQLAEGELLSYDYASARRIREVVAGMDANNLVGLIETVLQSALMPAPRNALLKRLLTELRQRDTTLFLEASMRVRAGALPAQVVAGDSYAYFLRNGAENAFRLWMAAHPAEAAAWAQNNREAWREFGAAPIWQLSLAGLLQADPPRAYAMLTQGTTPECMEALWIGLPTLNPQQTTALAQWAAASVFDPDKRRRIVRKALFATASHDNSKNRLEAIRPLLLALRLPAEELSWVAPRLALDLVPRIASDLEKTPAREIAWLHGLLPAADAPYAAGAMGHFYYPNLALTYLNAQLDQAPNDDLIAGYVESADMRLHHDTGMTLGVGIHEETAFRLATRVQEPERRLALLWRAWTDLQKDSLDTARDILAIPELHEEDRAALEAQIALIPEKKS